MYVCIKKHFRREGEKKRERGRRENSFQLLFLYKLPSHSPVLTNRGKNPQFLGTYTAPVSSLTAQDLPWHQKREVNISFPFVQLCAKIQKQVSPSPDSN